jgi:aspartyl-tRNA(Asn)/glutamyl-tRNA(Gln) amidotransferase subunit B
MVARIRAALPESPERKHRRYLAQGVAATDARVLSGNLALATLFEEVATCTDAAWAAKWFRRDVNSYAEEDEQGFARLVEYHDQVGALFTLAFRKSITDQTCKELLKLLSQGFIDTEEHVRSRGLAAVADSPALEAAVDAALAQSPAAVDEIRAGKEKAVNFIVGKVMAHTRGTARPDAVKALVLRKIQGGEGNDNEGKA